MSQSDDKWKEWYERLQAVEPQSREWYEIASMMENQHVRASIVNYPKSHYDEGHLLETAQDAVRSAEHALGKNHPRAAEAVQNLGFYYMVVKNDPDTAIDYFDKARSIAGDRNPALALTYYRLGLFWYRKKDAAKAEESLREALAIRRLEPTVDPEDLAETLFILSYPTAITTGAEEAIQMAQEALDIVRAKAPNSWLLPEIEKHLNDLRKHTE